jgi:zinc transporter ZupT
LRDTGSPVPFKRTHTRKNNTMNAIRIVGIVLIIGGLVGFFTGGFNFTKEKTAAKIGPLELTVKEKESVNIPQWLSIGVAVAGALMLVAGSRKS